MNYMNNQQGQLPFNPQGLNGQPCSFAPNQPPVNVPPMQVPINIQYFIPFAAAAFANEVSQKAAHHSGRMFLFNQITDRGYQNNEYNTGVALTLDLICLALVKGVFRSPEEAVAECAQRAASLLSAINFSKYPVLNNYVTPDVVQAAQRASQELPGLIQEINGAKQRMSQGNNNQQMTNQGGYRNQQNPMQYSQTPMGSPVGYSTGIFSGNGTPQSNYPSVPEPVNDKYSYLNITQKEQPMQEQPKTTYNAQVQARPTVDPLSLVDSIPDAKWIPRQRQPNPPAENPGVTKVTLIQEVIPTDGGYAKIARYVTEAIEGNNMDRKAHLITPLWNLVLTDKQDPVEISEVRVNRLNVFKETSKKLAQREVATATPIPKDTEFESPKGLPQEDRQPLVDDTPFIGCNYVEEAIFNGRLHSFKAGTDKEKGSVFRAKALIGIPVLSQHKYSSMVDDVKKYAEITLRYLRLCASFKLAVEHMHRTITSSNTVFAPFTIAVNKLLTYEINSVLRNKFSMSTEIESFVEDILLVEPDMRAKYGDVFADAFVKLQETFFETCFSEQDVETVFGPSPVELTDTVSLDYIGQVYSITYVNLLEAELDFAITDNRGTVLISENPIMRQIAKDALQFDTVFKLQSAHNLVVTLDDKVFEVHRGVVSHGSFLVSNFNKP